MLEGETGGPSASSGSPPARGKPPRAQSRGGRTADAEATGRRPIGVSSASGEEHMQAQQWVYQASHSDHGEGTQDHAQEERPRPAVEG